VCAVTAPKRIEAFKVFLVTTFFSVFAYVWLFLVLSVISPNVVDLWEAILTLLFFIVLIVLAYAAEKNFFINFKYNPTKSKHLVKNTALKLEII
jgi:solute carrier family 8 (sodium/calcium exchanger)